MNRVTLLPSHLRRCAPQLQSNQTTVYPLRRQFFLHRILPQARFQSGEIYTVQLLILIETREYIGSFASYRVNLRLQALRTDFFHHALHR